MSVKVLFFAIAKDLAGKDCDELDIEERVSVGDVKKILIERHEALEELLGEKGTANIARNGKLAIDTDTCEPGDELAVIPPVSGG